jgi:tetratricopeptide (TPR) repeat protein
LLGHRLTNAPGTDAQGQALLAESLQLYQELGDRRRILGVLKIVGFSAVLRGELVRGESLLRESLAIAQEMPGDVEIVDSTHLLAHGLAICGKYTEACALAEANMLRCRALGHRPWLARTFCLIANAELGAGRYASAYEQGLRGLQAAEEIDDPVLASFALWRLGDIKLVQGYHAEAADLLQQSSAAHRRLQIQGRLQDVLASEGCAAYARGQTHAARGCLVEALQTALRDRLWFTAVRGLPLAALDAAGQGQAAAAVELYALASSVPHVANSTWFGDVVGRRVAEAAQVLTTVEVCAAQERGRTRDLWQTIEEVLAGLLQKA